LHAPHFHHDKGWDGYGVMPAHPMTHIWCMSMDPDDLQRLRQQCDHRAGNRVRSFFTKHGAGHEEPWVAYIQGEYPEYPVEILRHNHAQVHQRLAFMRDDQQDPETYGDWYLQVRNPISTEGLLQLTMGGPLCMYNGGLLQARLRYFDPQRRRPGLPPDVAALVETLADSRVVVRLVNLSATEDRQVLLQAGVFGEHRFTCARYQRRRAISADEAGVGHTHEAEYREGVQRQLEDRTAAINGTRFLLRLEPGAEICLDLEMERHVNDPSYALPFDESPNESV